MKKLFRIISLAVTVAAVTIWIALGANMGWTRTSVPVKILDEVTGIEGIEYRKQFRPGIELLLVALFGAGLLGGASLFFRTQQNYTTDMKKTLITIVTVTASVCLTQAEPLKFDFKDPKGVNNVVFSMDAPLEAIQGSASGISGTVTFDPAKPASTAGKIVVASSSLHVPNPMMKEHMHGGQWMDVSKHPEITFETKELKNVKTTGDATTADAVGKLTIRGVSKDVTVPVKLTYLKDKLNQRVPNLKGDLLVIRSNFKVKRADFGINPGAPTDKVAEDIDLSLSIAGAAAR